MITICQTRVKLLSAIIRPELAQAIISASAIIPSTHTVAMPAAIHRGAVDNRWVLGMV